MKRKQQDFQKVKLKVGKHLPKGRNETRTSFQTKKINVQEQIRETAEEPTLKELLSFMKSSDVKTKFCNLRKLLKYVSDNKDTLSMYFPDILKELGRTLQESDPEIRSQAISVLGRCAEILSDIQFKPFVVPLSSYLNCMMTHISFPVRQDSLKFLDVLLHTHSNIACQSFDILVSLLNLISCKDSSTIRKGSKNKDGRKLLDVISSKMSADEWRTQVLERMLTVLNEILVEKKSEETDDQKEIYWDAKETLYLPLYMNSGVEPAKLESLYQSVNSEASNPAIFKKLIPELICILSAILKSFSMIRSFTEANVKYLLIITQILCCTGEWSIKNLDPDDDLNPGEKLVLVCEQLLKGFPYTPQAGRQYRNYEVECVNLNLGITYLYCICSLLTDYLEPSFLLEQSYFERWEVIKLYIINMFQVSGARMTEKSISLSLKICKVLIRCEKIDDSGKNGFLVALLGTLDTHRFSSKANDIYAFFMDLTLNFEHRGLLDTQAVRNWFQGITTDLSSMMESRRVVPGYYAYIRQICARRNPDFMETLPHVPFETYIEFLKFNDEDFQLTIIYLIVSLQKITNEFLEDLAITIREASFSVKMAYKLICMLDNRFSNSETSADDQQIFVKFLMNVACDTLLLMDPSFDTNPLPLTDMVLKYQNGFRCRCEIYPTSDFAKRRAIMKVCIDCLNSYLRKKCHVASAVYFIRSILADNVKFPIHTMVAVLELFKNNVVLYTNIALVEFLHHFIYSSLVYNSFITYDVPPEHWEEYCVPDVQECLDVVDPIKICKFIDADLYSFKELQLLHSMRVLLFLTQRGLFNEKNQNVLYLLCEKMGTHETVNRSQKLRDVLEKLFHWLSIISGNN